MLRRGSSGQAAAFRTLRLRGSFARLPGLSPIRPGSATPPCRTARCPLALRARTTAAGPAASARSCRGPSNRARDQQWKRLMTTSGISDQRSPDSIKVGGWLFRHRTSIPVPFALALLFVRVGEAPFSWTLAGAGAILIAAGEGTRLWAVRHIGAISRTRSDRLGPLIATGPFGLVRNPLYIGNILLWVGFAVTARLVWMAPVVLILLGLEYHAIVQWEEQL